MVMMVRGSQTKVHTPMKKSTQSKGQKCASNMTQVCRLGVEKVKAAKGVNDVRTSQQFLCGGPGRPEWSQMFTSALEKHHQVEDFP